MQSVTVILLSAYGVRGWEEKNPYRILVEKPLGKVHLEDEELDKEIER